MAWDDSSRLYGKRKFHWQGAVGWQQLGLERETAAYFRLPEAIGDRKTINDYIRSIKKGIPVVLSSVTLNMSTTATGLITNVSQDIRWTSSTVWGGTALQLTVNDGTNDFTLTPGAAGTGEGLDVDLIGTINFTSGWSGDATIDAAQAEHGNNNTFLNKATIGVPAMGYLYKMVRDITAVGTLRIMTTNFARLYSSSNGVIYFNKATDNQNNEGISFLNISNPTTVTGITTLSMQKVLTPDITGLAFTSGSGASFLPNAATKSITITLAP